MRLGGPVFDTANDPESLVKYHQHNGFSAAYMGRIDDKVKRDEICAACAEANIVLSEHGAYGINILETDDALRQKNFDEICNRLAYAEEVGIRCCVIHGGSYQTGGWGQPNPDNFSARAFDDTVKAVQEIVDAVRPVRTKLVMETEKYVYPDDPDIYLQLIEAIDRPSFGVHLDPINIVSSPKLLYTNGAFVKDCFEKLGAHVVSCHSKDVTTLDKYPYHITETFTGNGVLDYDVYLTELARLDDDIPLMIEHLDAEQLPKARDFLLQKADEVGVSFVKPTS
jgi:sugar phosphate isomerase/epimerase